MSYDLLKIRSHVSFDVYPTAILGTRFTNVKILALFDELTARQFTDTRARHTGVISTLPPGTPTVPDDFTFARVQFTDGSTDVIALPWIKEDTITVEGTRAMRLTIENVSPDDRPRILLAISALGFTASEMVEI